MEISRLPENLKPRWLDILSYLKKQNNANFHFPISMLEKVFDISKIKQDMRFCFEISQTLLLLMGDNIRFRIKNKGLREMLNNPSSNASAAPKARNFHNAACSARIHVIF
jgi:hypothetical protein